MSFEGFGDFLLWCFILNYIVLLIWFLFTTLAPDRFYALAGKRFGLTREDFDRSNYHHLVLFKIGVLIFNLVPWLALRIVG